MLMKQNRCDSYQWLNLEVLKLVAQVAQNCKLLSRDHVVECDNLHLHSELRHFVGDAESPSNVSATKIFIL